MKILVFGNSGQVGRAVEKQLGSENTVIGLNRHSEQYCGDLTDLQGIESTIKKIAPDIVVNAAAYTAVDRAEAEVTLAELVNGSVVGVMAEAARALNSLLVHFSSDYVYGGDGNEARLETEIPNPLSAYGRSKLLGDQLILASGCRHLILRTSWVFAIQGKNFISTMLHLATERDTLNIVSDQVGSPTSAETIATTLAAVLPQVLADCGKQGLYHLVASGYVSWYDYAQFIFQVAREQGMQGLIDIHSVNAVASETMSFPARRPKNSRLSVDKIERTFGIKMPPWREDVCRCVMAILAAR